VLPKNAYLVKGTESETSVLLPWKSLGMFGKTNLNYESVPLLSSVCETSYSEEGSKKLIVHAEQTLNYFSFFKL